MNKEASISALPQIAHAKAEFNRWGRVVITMDDGWLYWDRQDYGTDENGGYIEPLPEDISYSRRGVFSPGTDFNRRIVTVSRGEAAV